jgi:hypothetical protein
MVELVDESKQRTLLDGLHAEIERMAILIDAPSRLLPQREAARNSTWLSLAQHDADDFEDVDGWYLSLIRNEDGHDWELAEVSADEPDYLLYVLFDEITAKLARAAVPGSELGDLRAIWFREQEALLGRLNATWRARTASRHAQMLSA